MVTQNSERKKSQARVGDVVRVGGRKLSYYVAKTLHMIQLCGFAKLSAVGSGRIGRLFEVIGALIKSQLVEQLSIASVTISLMCDSRLKSPVPKVAILVKVYVSQSRVYFFSSEAVPTRSSFPRGQKPQPNIGEGGSPNRACEKLKVM